MPPPLLSSNIVSPGLRAAMVWGLPHPNPIWTSWGMVAIFSEEYLGRVESTAMADA